MPLMDIEKTLTADDDRTTLVFPFKVPENIRLLSLHMTYAPVWLEDRDASKALIQKAMRLYTPLEAQDNWRVYLPLSNLITLSLDDPMSYRGNAHRRAGNQVHTLSAGAASPGFYKGDILPGTWRASIHIHALVVMECTLRLTIQGVDA